MSEITINRQRWSLEECWPLYWDVFSLLNNGNKPHVADGGHVYVQNGRPRTHAVLELFGMDVPQKPVPHVVHHLNEFPADDRPENLEVMTRGRHVRLHHKGVPAVMPAGHAEKVQATMKARAALASWREQVEKMHAPRTTQSYIAASQKGAEKRRGQKRSAESRQRMSEAAKRREYSPDSPEVRARKKEAQNRPEVKEKLRLLRLGHAVSEETKQKISAALQGRQFSSETLQKMSVANARNTASATARRRLSEQGRRGAAARWKKETR